MRKYIVQLVWLVLLSGAMHNASANQVDAKNFLAVAIDSIPSKDDPRILTVQRQLEAIESACARTSSGAGIHDKLGKAHSLINVQQSLLELLTDFGKIANAQCANVQDTLLISLYVLERNAGNSHAATVGRLIRNPNAIAAKYRAR